MYKPDKLRQYIETSALRAVNDRFRVRLSEELAEKYDAGAYTNAINNLEGCIKQIRSLGLKYPGKAKPIFYLYLVPDDDFVDLLNYPHKTQKGGGKPVFSYDLDGFNKSYGVSQNMGDKEPGVSRTVNVIHELAHLVHSQFFYKNRFISEGFAETLPLYTMDYESKFDEHRQAIKNLKPNQIFSARELLSMERDGAFRGKMLIPNRSCSFDLAYISSYLFIRGCMETIASKFNINRAKATQKFLEIVRSSQCTDEWLVYDLAGALDISQDELLNKKILQIGVLKSF